MKVNHFSNKDTVQPLDIIGGMDRDKMGRFGKSIHDNPNSIKTKGSAR